MREDTIPFMFFSRANKYGGKCALRSKENGKYRDISWAEAEGKVKDLAIGLISLGLKPGEKVGLLSENRPEWAYSDLAVLSLGCADVPLYPTDVSLQMEYILRDSGCAMVIVSTREQLDKIISIKQGLPELRKIIMIDLPEKTGDAAIIPFESVLKAGASKAPELRGEFEFRLNAAGKDGLASIIYTSGTTGAAKGVCLTHENFLSNCRSSVDLLPLGEDDTCLSFLPLSHVFERMASYYFTMFVGGTIAYAGSNESVAQDLKDVRPTYACSVPRFYEKMHANIMDSVSRSPEPAKKIFERSAAAAKRYADAKLNKLGPGPVLWLEYQLAKALVFSKIRDAVGGRIKFFISGGAPLSKELGEFFYSFGIFIFEGYGLTETSPVVTVNTFKAFRFGSVGKPIHNTEVRIAPDGEILITGPGVMKAYYKKETETKEAFDADGRFRTGDIGYLDEEGFLYITDRKKDIIITAGGKNIAPQNIENTIRSDSYIHEVILHGDRRPYITALIVPNFDALKGLALRQGIPYIKAEELARHPRVRDFIADRIEQKQKDFANYEKIKKFTMLENKLTIEGGEITPTLKVKRKAVAEKYKDIFDGMYRS
ncbi:MAG: long-chain fatty acid--CoA ligase [Candidatus Omnitrophica bacterium]|nr:long-chain fatty acid--CoA ligase [Candidatus Omnitrophota bacterium]